MRGDGNNLFNPKYLLPFIFDGEEDELLTYFPEVKEQFFKLKGDVLREYINLLELWNDCKEIELQKDFALAIKGKTPYTSVLFNLRKKDKDKQKSVDIRREWREAEDQIIKRFKLQT